MSQIKLLSTAKVATVSALTVVEVGASALTDLTYVAKSHSNLYKLETFKENAPKIKTLREELVALGFDPETGLPVSA